VIFLYFFIISRQLGAGHRWIFFRLLGFDCDDQSCPHIFLRSSDKWYFVYSLGSKVNCHTTSQHGNNRTNVWIETQKLKTLKKLNTWWFQTISVFETSLYFYKMWVWNTIFRTGIKRNKPFVFQGNIAVLQKIIGITSIVWTITQPENKQHFKSYVTVFRVIFRLVKSCLYME